MRFVPLAAAALAISPLAACDRPARGEPVVEVEEAWVRLPAVPGRPAAAYFTLRAYNADIRLAGVTSPEAERVELHDTRMENGVMRMAPLERAVIPAGRELAFEPGGAHAMLFGVSEGVRPGGRMALTFTFEGAAPIDVQAEVRAAGDDAGHGH
jgi:periplasmic copper chaperone A